MFSHRLIRFSIVGAVGFVADIGILYGMLSIGVGPFAARLVSFLGAVIVTWQLNRRMTFEVSARQDLVREGLIYLSAMSFGGLLNLMTYTAVLRSCPSQVWAPALGVAAGSLVGLIANYSLAQKWVFKTKPYSIAREGFTERELNWLLLGALQLIFWAGALHSVNLPGLYMDAVNPDYLAARTLHPEIQNPVNAMPTASVPLLGSLYHGVQNYYVTLPVVGLLGFNLPALRIAQALFGAGIVTLTFLLSLRMGASRLIAFVTAALLATDIAFLASFRTQFYIVMSGVFWLFAAVYVALEDSKDNFYDRQRTLISGALYGLAVYSYFIFLFFLPVWLILIWRNTQGWQTLVRWSVGFCMGMMPYVLGYLSLLIALGGLNQAIEWISQSLVGLAPLSSKLSFLDSVFNSLRNASYALQNTGNELMIFGHSLGNIFTEFKAFWLVLGTVLLTFLPFKIKTRSQLPKQLDHKVQLKLVLPHQLGWFLFAFMLISLAFGSRIWIHHFSILVPLLYLLAIAGYSRWFNGPLTSLVLVMLLAVGALNLYQQAVFFNRLEETGGVGKMSNAQTQLVEDALTSPRNTIYLFPEWGFFMPFAFLTGNQKSYELDVSIATLQKHQRQGHSIRIAFWNSSDEMKYRELLTAQGFEKQELIRYEQRNQQPAFFVIHGSP